VAVPARFPDDKIAPRSRSPLPATTIAPPPRGLPLGSTLGLILALAIALVLGGFTGLEQHRELAMEKAMREARLAARISSLGAGLDELTDPAGLPSVVDQIRRSAVAVTGEDHGVELRDHTGRVVAIAAPGDVFRPPANSLKAEIEVRSPALAGGSGEIAAWQDGSALAADRTQLWRDWAIDLLLTSLAVIFVVELAVHFLVGRPLKRLVGGLQRLEQGHMGPLEPGPGAWEIRWLAWRFEVLGRELADNARRLVAAERRALDAIRSLPENHGPLQTGIIVAASDERSVASADRSSHDLLAHQFIEDSCKLLESLRSDDALAHEIAEEAWSKTVPEAERVGDFALKARLEDAALRILEPEAFVELEAELEALRFGRQQWCGWVVDRLTEALDSKQVAIDQIQHRAKHTAGVWRKMREAQLAVDQVHDLFAFRVIVPSVSDCYLALAAVHSTFEPEPFRFKDYIEVPKPNGYRSLHTTVRDEEGRLFEVQIRTSAMHDNAEFGRAAHWRYRNVRWGSISTLRRLTSGRWSWRGLRRRIGA
jgi:HAMP domain-containing protein